MSKMTIKSTALRLAALSCLLFALVAGCSDERDGSVEGSPLRLASTTSTVGSGLFDALMPAFERRAIPYPPPGNIKGAAE
jgi:ABC-type tungstate transport system permease subunit